MSLYQLNPTTPSANTPSAETPSAVLAAAAVCLLNNRLSAWRNRLDPFPD
jgi:hypothetical protein